jgi:peroxiredoxin
MIQIGDQVPDLDFQRPDGSACRLSDYQGRKLLLIFLRHLA